MRYYVEINGNSSLDIIGLAISELPSISKPLQRSNREEIDGRDGDVITKLGYSAYDKTLKIGLWGNYNINDVISFFNASGKITFSNEPDKYYYFEILNRADFINQLEAFRTASITIHCQPFKYSAVEEKQIFTIDEETSVNVYNNGNIESKPIIKITGSGDISLSLNGNQIFQIALGTDGYITIDTSNMEAYKDGVLKNRLVQGDYSNFALIPGKNTISFSGTITQIEIDNYSRWI